MGRLIHVATCIWPARPFLQRSNQNEAQLQRFRSVTVTEAMKETYCGGGSSCTRYYPPAELVGNSIPAQFSAPHIPSAENTRADAGSGILPNPSFAHIQGQSNIWYRNSKDIPLPTPRLTNTASPKQYISDTRLHGFHRQSGATPSRRYFNAPVIPSPPQAKSSRSHIHTAACPSKESAVSKHRGSARPRFGRRRRSLNRGLTMNSPSEQALWGGVLFLRIDRRSWRVFHVVRATSSIHCDRGYRGHPPSIHHRPKWYECV
ncbi:hypothetical protein GQ600_12318 [Phytophthora cactorum]|nr:hypothetical protein GQ600_12318 [Phytophthora cactorum]